VPVHLHLHPHRLDKYLLLLCVCMCNLQMPFVGRWRVDVDPAHARHDASTPTLTPSVLITPTQLTLLFACCCLFVLAVCWSLARGR
jgi:hypothetical protein